MQWYMTRKSAKMGGILWSWNDSDNLHTLVNAA